uniref:Uncharacterized protein n=1 Tax=Strombidinopsis acuminata TaxID=141414 RepID=A0A7S3X106_9SPIT
MGAAIGFGRFYDAFGVPLQEGMWVESTTANGIDTSAGMGRVKLIGDSLVVFSWQGWTGATTYQYSQKDIEYYGLRGVAADVDGRKFQLSQRVETTRQRHKVGIVTHVSADSVTVSFYQDKGNHSNYSQSDVDSYGMRITADNAGSRRCAGGDCI